MQKWISGLLTLGCLSAGYTYYKMNPNDLIPAIAFTIGMTGILLSFLRQSKK